MTTRQKKAATALSLAIVVAAFAYLTWIAICVAAGTARGDEPPARLFMLAINNWDALAIAFKAMPLIVSVGLAFLGSDEDRDALFYGMLTVAVIGLGVSAYLLLELDSVSTSKLFWQYSPVDSIQDYETFTSATRKALVPVCIWFVSVIGIELGLPRR